MTLRSKLGALACALAMAGPTGAVSMYVAVPVGAPNLGSYIVTGISNSGQMAGWLYGPAFAYTHAWVEEAGVVKDLGTLGGNDSYAFAISRNGKVAGYSYPSGSTNAHAFLYQGGALVDIGTLGGSGSVGNAVNDAGQVAGHSTLPGDAASSAFLYSNGVMTNIGGLGGTASGSLATGINNNGHVVGISNVPGRQYGHGFVYANGTMTDIGAIPGTNVPDGYASSASAINDSGQVAGSAAEVQWGPAHAIIYKNGAMTKLDPGMYASYGRAINNPGEVTGTMFHSAQSTGRAFVYSGGTMFDLNDLVVSGTMGWPLVDGLAINDSGQIIVQSCLANQCIYFRLDPIPDAKGNGTVVANPYGAMSVTGATLVGNTISNLSGDVVITLGPSAGMPGSFAEIEFQGLNVGPNHRITVRPGAAGQTLVLKSLDAFPLAVAGTVEAALVNGVFAKLYLHSRNGITITPTGRVLGWGGATLEALGDDWYDGAQPVINQGFVSGGSSLAVNAASIFGSGEFQANDMRLSALAFANNGVHGQYFLQNGLKVTPGAGSDVRLTLHGYGPQRQVFNVAVSGNVILAMPSAWPAGSSLPSNNATVPFGGTRPAGAPVPAYGGGSMIVQATGSLALDGGVSNDFVFPGGVVLIAGTVIDTKGVVVSNGWSTAGTQFQGIFFEAPTIKSSAGKIAVYTNDLNWVNFSTHPTTSVTAAQLAADALGNAIYVNADAWATHLNTYSILSNAAANGECYVCLVNAVPVDLR